MTPSQANAIWTVLVEECGARESHRETFIRCMQGECVQYRFGGSLGSGGKFWNEKYGWLVSCYRKDETPERLAAIDAANVRLKALWERERGKMTVDEVYIKVLDTKKRIDSLRAKRSAMDAALYEVTSALRVAEHDYDLYARQFFSAYSTAREVSQC